MEIDGGGGTVRNGRAQTQMERHGKKRRDMDRLWRAQSKMWPTVRDGES